MNLNRLAKQLYNEASLETCGVQIKLEYHIDFEGFYGRASEDLEY